jgi:ATP-dependent helicase IRC3
MTLFPEEVAQPVRAIQLFDYQEEDRAKTVSAFLGGESRLLGVWPTGSGKTVLFSELHLEPRMKAWLHTFPPDKRQILVLAHRDELIKQAVTKIQRSNPDLSIGVEKASQQADLDDDVIVASVQTLSSSKGKRLRKLDPNRFRMVVVDEAHHAASPSYIAILQHFGFLPPAEFMAETRPKKEHGRSALLVWQRARLTAWDNIQAFGNHSADKLLLGVTATSKRGDNIGLEAIFNEIVFERSIREMIEKGRLCRLRAFRVNSDTSLDDVGTRAGDFEQEKLAAAVNVDKRNTVAVKAYLEFAPGRKGITFCANVAHAMSMAETYNNVGVPALCVHGKMSDTDRTEALRLFNIGEIKMLTNCNVLTEGFDEPDVQVIVHARPTKSSLLYIQMTGRGLRVHPGKENCIIIDIVDVTRKHSLMTSPELLGLPMNFDAKGGDLLEAKEKLEATQAAFPLANLDDIKSLDDCKLRVAEVDLLGNFHDEVLDQPHTKLSWERTGEGYEINWKGQLLNEFAQVVQEDGQWKFKHNKGRRTEFQQNHPTPEAALRAAERWVEKNKPSAWALNQKHVKDGHEPASKSQIDMIQAFGLRTNAANLTRGDARLILQHHYAKQRRYDAGQWPPTERFKK